MEVLKRLARRRLRAWRAAVPGRASAAAGAGLRRAGWAVAGLAAVAVFVRVIGGDWLGPAQLLGVLAVTAFALWFFAAVTSGGWLILRTILRVLSGVEMSGAAIRGRNAIYGFSLTILILSRDGAIGAVAEALPLSPVLPPARIAELAALLLALGWGTMLLQRYFDAVAFAFSDARLLGERTDLAGGTAEAANLTLAALVNTVVPALLTLAALDALSVDVVAASKDFATFLVGRFARLDLPVLDPVFEGALEAMLPDQMRLAP